MLRRVNLSWLSSGWRRDMATERPVLTARWSDLLLFNFAVPPELIARLAPRGTEPDLYQGQAYISIVGFRFQNTRLFGVPIPGHTRFAEINLRYYVRRRASGQLRRGVVFVKEIAPRRAVAAAAKWLYNENYIVRPMRSCIKVAGGELGAGDTIEYAWQNARRPPLGRRARELCWNRLAGRVAGSLQPPAPGSMEEYIFENYWGYVSARDLSTREYRVVHEPWRVAPINDVEWDCDLAANYDGPWTEYLAVPPASAMIADGSAIQLFRGRRL